MSKADSAGRFDYVVVGGGSAGCVVAARLAESGEHSVLLLEAGGGDRHPFVRMPFTWIPASETRSIEWGYFSEAEEETGGRRVHEPRGRLIGGTSSIHGMMYSRGHSLDYDDWAAAGLDGWSYAEVLPYFRRNESNWRGAGPFHGDAGPVRVTANPKHPMLYPAMIAAARERGLAETDDFNGAQLEGFGMPDFMVRGGRRESSATAMLHGRRPRTLTVRRRAVAHRILLDGDRATGVEYRRGGRIERVEAGEVVVSAGAFGSPHLLQLSGIGDPVALTAAGVTARHELPTVGRNLQDHPMIATFFQGEHGLGLDRMLRLDHLALAFARWSVTGGGYLGEAPMSVQGFARVAPDADRPDMQLQVVHIPYVSKPQLPWQRRLGDQFMIGALQLDPSARGEVSLRSADPEAAPRIRFGLLKDERDRRAAREMVRFIRDFAGTDALRGIVGPEAFPGAGVTTDAELDAWARANLQAGKHPVGTCAMGVDAQTSVVDAQLRVHGLEGLRVADASVMPTIIRGNTDAPTKMIAEKAADLVLGRTLTEASAR